jgi:hypothetical protein
VPPGMVSEFYGLLRDLSRDLLHDLAQLLRGLVADPLGAGFFDYSINRRKTKLGFGQRTCRFFPNAVQKARAYFNF